MATHKSAIKRIRQNKVRNQRNRYVLVSTRNAMKKLRSIEDKTEAEKYLPEVVGMVDKLAKKNIYHKNKASNLKSQLARFVNSL
ncbi:MAG: 30S ribosomal protein S20 [Bacteroidota bacterium]|nr:30S ribosomal protein S20 [Bacteroidota bacterium]